MTYRSRSTDTAPAGYIAERAGTQHWVLALRLTPRLRERGYTIAITRTQYDAWQEDYRASQLTARREASTKD